MKYNRSLIITSKIGERFVCVNEYYIFKNNFLYVNIINKNSMGNRGGLYMDIFMNFVERQGIIYVMLFLFLCGFALKTICSLCYDEVVNKIDYLQLKTNKIAGEIIRNYETDLKLGKNIKNTEVYVKTELHKWKKFGLVVEKMSSIGDGFGKMCFVVGALTDILLLSVQDVRELFGNNYMNKVYIYGALSIVLMLILKMWSNFLSIDYKRNRIKDEIINYIDNHPSYVKLFAERQQTEKNDNQFLENYLQKEQALSQAKDTSNDKIIKFKTDQASDQKLANGTKEVRSKSKSSGYDDKNLLISEVLDEFLS